MSFEDISTIEECATASAQALANHILACWEEKSKEGDFLGVAGFEQGRLGLYQTCLNITAPLFFREGNHSLKAQLSSFLFLLPDLPFEELLEKCSQHRSSKDLTISNPPPLTPQKIVNNLKKELEKASQLYYSLPSGKDQQARVERERLDKEVSQAERSLQSAKIISSEALEDVFKKEAENLFENVSQMHERLSPLSLSLSTPDTQVHPTLPKTLKRQQDKKQQERVASSTSFSQVSKP